MDEILEAAKVLYIDIEKLGCDDNYNDNLAKEVNSGSGIFDIISWISLTKTILQKVKLLTQNETILFKEWKLQLIQ